MSVITNNERSLLERAAAFDESALSEIYDCHQEALYRYAMRLLGDQQLAEDCLAETFFRFLKSLSKGNIPQENLRAYLFRISHNWITDHYRRNQKSNEQELDEHFFVFAKKFRYFPVPLVGILFYRDFSTWIHQQ